MLSQGLLSSLLNPILLSLASITTGLARSGLGAIGTLSTPLLTFAYQAREAAGITTILLVIGDIGAIIYFRKKCILDVLKKALPLSLLGMVLSFVIGNYFSNKVYISVITAFSGLAVIIMTQNYFRTHVAGGVVLTDDPHYGPHKGLRHYIILYSSGIVAGISTVLSNNSSIFMFLFLTELNLKKDALVGTIVWYFGVINIIKLFTHIFFWHSIPGAEVSMVLLLSPFIYVGFFFGVWIVKMMSEKFFQLFILCSSFFAFLLLLVRVILDGCH